MASNWWEIEGRGDANRRFTEWDAHMQRIATGEWRARVMRDLVLSDAKRLREERGSLCTLDIGCGLGFDNEVKFQTDILRASTRYIGVEPDPGVPRNPDFHEWHVSDLEHAPIEPGSVDLAFCVMVLEHLSEPDRFWSRVHQVLRPGGVFWGFTIDSRHWFAACSAALAKLKLKDLYLSLLFKSEPNRHYINYPTHYRSNKPREVMTLASTFASTETCSVYLKREMEGLVPSPFGLVIRGTEAVRRAARRPGSQLMVRAVR